MIATWYLIVITYYGGAQPIEFESQKACVEARETVKRNNPSGWSIQTMCVPKNK